MTTKATTNPCPFCGAKQRRYLSHLDDSWVCGTSGPDDEGLYKTGVACDKTVFRRAFLRCLELLQRVMDCSIGIDSQGRTDVRLTPQLVEDIRQEVEEYPEEVVK